MRVWSFLLLALLCSFAFGDTESEMETREPKCTGTAMYAVTNMCQWTSMRHPTDYPSDAGFSPMCGTAHNSEYMMFYEGGTSTEGVKDVAEMGDCAALEGEVETCVMEDYCAEGSYFSWMCEPTDENAGTGVCTHSGTIEVSAAYPYVSMVSMAVPSPDWFVGVSSLNLCVEGEDGEYVWVDRYPETDYVNLYAWDAGTDGGPSFASEDDPLEMFEPITQLSAMDTTNIFYNEEAEMLYPLCQVKLEKM